MVNVTKTQNYTKIYMNNILPNGFLCVIEGIDGSGKSSLAKALKNLLAVKFPVILTKEPGGTPFGQHIRALVQNPTTPLSPRAEFLLFAADRAQHFQELVIPLLQNGNLVISDRMADSAVAYQGFGRGLSQELITQVNTWAMQNRKPDLILYLALDYTTAQQRLAQRHETASVFDTEKEQFFKKVNMGFETIYKNRNDVLTLDATQSVEKLAQQAAQHLEEAIAKKLATQNVPQPL